MAAFPHTRTNNRFLNLINGHSTLLPKMRKDNFWLNFRDTNKKGIYLTLKSMMSLVLQIIV